MPPRTKTGTYKRGGRDLRSAYRASAGTPLSERLEGRLQRSFDVDSAYLPPAEPDPLQADGPRLGRPAGWDSQLPLLVDVRDVDGAGEAHLGGDGGGPAGLVARVRGQFGNTVDSRGLDVELQGEQQGVLLVPLPEPVECQAWLVTAGEVGEQVPVVAAGVEVALRPLRAVRFRGLVIAGVDRAGVAGRRGKCEEGAPWGGLALEPESIGGPPRNGDVGATRRSASPGRPDWPASTPRTRPATRR